MGVTRYLLDEGLAGCPQDGRGAAFLVSSEYISKGPSGMGVEIGFGHGRWGLRVSC
jgi:hypothetical protein